MRSFSRRWLTASALATWLIGGCDAVMPKAAPFPASTPSQPSAVASEVVTPPVPTGSGAPTSAPETPAPAAPVVIKIEIEAPEEILDLLRDSEAWRLHLVRAATAGASDALNRITGRTYPVPVPDPVR